MTTKEESIKNAVLPSNEDLKTFVEAWLARPENALEAEGAAACASDGQKATDVSAPVGAAMPHVPPTATAAVPTPTTAAIYPTTMTQQERENIAASRAFNEAIQSGSPFKMAKEEAAAAAARANQNLPAPTSPHVQKDT
eukprot:scaffold374_cov94-Skeletonema_dohrnii-CCMP3373.AAC.5